MCRNPLYRKQNGGLEQNPQPPEVNRGSRTDSPTLRQFYSFFLKKYTFGDNLTFRVTADIVY